jgi:hypothetical protein
MPLIESKRSSGVGVMEDFTDEPGVLNAVNIRLETEIQKNEGLTKAIGEMGCVSSD